MATIILTNQLVNSGLATSILGGEITYGWKNRTLENPSDSNYGIVESQFSGWENPIINLTFYLPMDNLPSGNVMTWKLWNDFVKNQYNGHSSTQTTMGILFSNTIAFSSFSASSASVGTSSIPIQIKSYNVRFSPSDSNNGLFWTINAQIVETS